MRSHTQPSPQISSVNETFLFSLVFSPFIIFCLLVVRIISRVMNHSLVEKFPSHLPSLFLSPTHSHTDEQTSISYSLSLTHAHSNIHTKSSPAALICSSIFYFFFLIILFSTPICLFCAQCYLCLFCVLDKQKQHF